MKKVAILSTLLMAGVILVPTTSFAEEVAQAKNTSDVQVTFEADEGKTDPSLPVDPVDPGNDGTGNKGPLSIDFISNIQFGAQKISGGTATYYAKNTNPYVQVTDKRGTGAGWLLTASASEFKGDNKGEEVALKGAILSFKNGIIQASKGNLSTAPKVSDVIFDSITAKTVMIAEKMQGMGTFIDVFEGAQDISLEVPSGVAITGVDYNASITWTLGDTPKG